MDDYAFMVVDAFGTTYKIWVDGRTEGFGPCAKVFNRMPRIINAAIDDAINSVTTGRTTHAELEEMAGVNAEALGVDEPGVDHYGCL